MKTFQEFLNEADEYAFIKKLGFKPKGKLSNGSVVHGHPDPEKGEVIIDKHGGWKHKPLVNGEPSEGTTGNTLKAHLGESLMIP